MKLLKIVMKKQTKNEERKERIKDIEQRIERQKNYREPAYNLNLHTITMKAHHKLMDIDHKFVGTENYMGLVYFHNHGYRHILRDDPSIAQRRRIHAELLKRGLKVDVMSKEHNEVIAKYMTGTISKISATPWTRQEILDYDLSGELK